MAAAYSEDLRGKVIAAIDRGEKKSQVSRMFNISRDTIDRWLKRRDSTGTLKATSGYQQGHSHCIKNWEEFCTFAQKHGDKTQGQMAQLWPGKMSKRTIARALAHIGWTRKKRPTAIENEMKSSVLLS